MSVDGPLCLALTKKIGFTEFSTICLWYEKNHLSRTSMSSEFHFSQINIRSARASYSSTWCQPTISSNPTWTSEIHLSMNGVSPQKMYFPDVCVLKYPYLFFSSLSPSPNSPLEFSLQVISRHSTIKVDPNPRNDFQMLCLEMSQKLLIALN